MLPVLDNRQCKYTKLVWTLVYNVHALWTVQDAGLDTRWMPFQTMGVLVWTPDGYVGLDTRWIPFQTMGEPVWTLVVVMHFGQSSCVSSLDTGKLNCYVRIFDNAELYIAVFETV